MRSLKIQARNVFIVSPYTLLCLLSGQRKSIQTPTEEFSYIRRLRPVIQSEEAPAAEPKYSLQRGSGFATRHPRFNSGARGTALSQYAHDVPVNRLAVVLHWYFVSGSQYMEGRRNGVHRQTLPK